MLGRRPLAGGWRRGRSFDVAHGVCIDGSLITDAGFGSLLVRSPGRAGQGPSPAPPPCRFGSPVAAHAPHPAMRVARRMRDVHHRVVDLLNQACCKRFPSYHRIRANHDPNGSVRDSKSISSECARPRLLAGGGPSGVERARDARIFIRGTDQNPVIHLCTEDQARREACSARDRAGQPAGATHASPLRIHS